MSVLSVLSQLNFAECLLLVSVATLVVYAYLELRSK